MAEISMSGKHFNLDLSEAEMLMLTRVLGCARGDGYSLYATMNNALEDAGIDPYDNERFVIDGTYDLTDTKGEL